MKQHIIPTKFIAIDNFSRPVDNMRQKAETLSSKLNKAGQSAFAVGRTAGAVGLAVATPLALAVRQAVKFEDKLADISKTTGLSGAELEKFGGDLRRFSTETRTSLEDLSTLGEIGGQLGIAKGELLDFIKSANKFNIALGKDFAGGIEEAASSVGKIKSLFADTRNLSFSESISRAGSAINELGAVGAATSSNITDFTLRLGALPDALKPSSSATLALGAYLQELGIDAQIGAGGMTNFLLVAGENIGKFANQMGASSKQASELLAQNPIEFAKKFATSLKGLSAVQVSQKLKDLKVGSQETIKVIGALGSNTSRLTELQNISSRAMADNTSLTNEANKKEQTRAAQLARLRNTVENLAISVGETLLPALTEFVNFIAPTIKSVSDWARENKELFSGLVKGIAVFGGIALAISGIAFAYGTYQKAVLIAESATKLFSTTLAINPYAVVAVGVIALANAFSNLYNKISLTNQIYSTAKSNTIEQRNEVASLFNTLKNTKSGTDSYNSALQKINEISPGLTEKYNLQAGAIRSIAQAEKDLTFQIVKRAKEQAKADLLQEKEKQFLANKLEGKGILNKAVNLLGLEDAFTTEQRTLRSEIDQLKRSIAEDQINALPASDRRPLDVNGSNNQNIAKNVLEMFANQQINVNITGLPQGVKATTTNGLSSVMPTVTSSR